ncbi:hypothetical protein [Mucilaginibacter sp. SG564]|uniref:hypothetical protein n=1 Tax=Mucilaginibacter sp. SG564 TaxID=2587022 RepID=UPI0015519356|nr:hypothetical protein [Mucilaginibacter sp. SG564]NOW97228.1 hypothetical protein [Mucilaginibacter sp. SG564]
MRRLKFEEFTGFSSRKKLVEFINENNIKQEDILKIDSFGGAFTLFYYVLE